MKFIIEFTFDLLLVSLAIVTFHYAVLNKLLSIELLYSTHIISGICISFVITVFFYMEELHNIVKGRG